MDLDDDFDIIPTKISKLSDDIQEKSETCIICHELFTTCGDHKLVSLKCGHTFGQNCIYQWLTKNSVCPSCRSHASKNDIRPVYIDISALKMEDNAELCKTTEDLRLVKIKLRESELECSHLMSKCGAFAAENQKLRDENELLNKQNLLYEHQFIKSEVGDIKKTIFKIMNKLTVSPEGECRVLAYSQLNSVLCVSAPSPNRLYPGYGVRLVSVKHGKLMKFHHLHSKMIRDIAFSPYNTSDLMLTGGLDKYIKITSLKVEKTVSSHLCQAPVWSCCWSNNNFSFYAGLSNGAVEEIDTRNLTTPVSTIWTQSGGPILSMRYVAGNKHIKSNGLLVTNSQNVLFLDNLKSTSDRDITDDSTPSVRANTLLLSSDYAGSLIHTSFNERTCHLLNTFRPPSLCKSQFLLSQLGSSKIDEVDVIYASDTKSYSGGTKKEFMNRSCFLDDGNSVNYVVCPDEESCSIKVWESNSNNEECVTLYPQEVSRTKPIIDVCQFNTDPLSFAAINCNNLYTYTQ